MFFVDSDLFNYLYIMSKLIIVLRIRSVYIYICILHSMLLYIVFIYCCHIFHKNLWDNTVFKYIEGRDLF